ncbi:cysteine desulfurase NifS [Desulfuribacillus stibiiarsenatis]|uniref:Cysteine desulfurase IscS n=1 Tax=Desulfuribacillus stibiiarsenatis TaxID=1390249 RepID=A0A1E5L9X5_9FIRM|nr:cysteine desulfurase NifS [Desulfuribacillus stibiiarsenatis]OEH86930.1 cysteine desulfurase NifS [Desulfuribacillus stibiiarsenatis]
MRKIYLDHGATTPMRNEVIDAMVTIYREEFGNPSSIHQFGRSAKKQLEDARAKVAKAIGADAKEIIFTGSGTEADNIAILGTARMKAKQGKGKHIITTTIEHHAVLDTCKLLEKEGFEVTYLPVDEHGILAVQSVQDALRDDTILVTIMHANNEIGSVQPIAEIGQLLKNHPAVFHTDAVQTVGKLAVDVNELAVDLLAISAHKIYGPKGVGALYVRKGIRVEPLMIGGGQERKIRPSTENLAGIVGLAVAIDLAVSELATESKRLEGLRDKLIHELLTKVPETKLNGHPVHRLPHNANISFEYIEGESLILSMDMKGIAVSSGSACTSGSLDPSHVLMAMGLCHQTAHGSLRMTLGKDTTEEDIDYVIAELQTIVARLREMSPVWEQYIKSKA